MDKTSTTYFMTQMIQEEFDELIKFRFPSNKDFETGWTRDERYQFNKIKMKQLEKMDNESVTK